MSLKFKNSSDLLSDLKSLREREKELVAEILNYLCEVEVRKLFLERGFPSMFAFCTDFLGYSKDEAYVRIQAIRLMRKIPEVEGKIREGKLSLTAAAKVQAVFRQENSRRKEEGQTFLSQQEMQSVIAAVEDQSTRTCERTLATLFPEVQSVPEKAMPLDETRTLIQFTAHENLMGKLEKLKSLLAHKNYEGRWDKLFTELADIALKKFESKLPKAKHLQVKSEMQVPIKKQNNQESLSVPSSGNAEGYPDQPSLGAHRGTRRYISVNIRREVYQRANGCCEYVGPKSGRKCVSQHALEIDHVEPVALGGGDELVNLRLLCSQHNKFRAWKTFGKTQ